MNPLLEKISNLGNTQANKISKLASTVRSIKDPTNNPQLQSLLSLYNGDAKTAFYSLCKQYGIDPEIILSQLR